MSPRCMFCGFPYRTVIACRVAQDTRWRLKSSIASMFLGDCHTNGRSLQPYPIGSPSDLRQILNLCDVEAKELNFQIRGDSETSFQSRPQKNFSQKGAGPGRWNQTSLSLTFHRRQSLTRGRRLKKSCTRSQPWYILNQRELSLTATHHGPVYFFMSST